MIKHNGACVCVCVCVCVRREREREREGDVVLSSHYDEDRENAILCIPFRLTSVCIQFKPGIQILENALRRLSTKTSYVDFQSAVIHMAKCVMCVSDLSCNAWL